MLPQTPSSAPSPARRWLFLLPLVAGLALIASAPVAGQQPGAGDPAAASGGHVVLLPVTGVVDQVMANYLRDGITRATNEGAAAVVIRLDTPGGSLDSTRSIVQGLLESRVPVIVWVAPSDFSISIAARVSIIEAKASPEVAMRVAMFSLAASRSCRNCSLAPEIV